MMYEFILSPKVKTYFPDSIDTIKKEAFNKMGYLLQRSVYGKPMHKSVLFSCVGLVKSIKTFDGQIRAEICNPNFVMSVDEKNYNTFYIKDSGEI